MYVKYVKRLLDILLSGIALLIGAPIIVIVALLVRFKLGSPVIFRQERPGKGKKIFTMCKFRTMTDDKDSEGNLLPDDVRLTKFGSFLRSTSLDELPELWNIFKGDMSIVGPRPQLVRDMVFFNEEQMKRQDVLPGLTGLAQVSGRNTISWEDKLNYDLKYMEKITFLGDCKIILSTVLKVFKREDISADGMSTAEDFGDYLLRVGQVSEAEYQQNMMLSKEIIEIYRNGDSVVITPREGLKCK
ncbi:sugar transferase [Turicibacter sanguinis]|uniref:sugar transferase n=1 Tax=Turicibacter sanguinis TaxID=154288 RepID=UPI0032EBBA35